MKTTTLRNTPTLFDAGQASYFNHDGEFDTLEATIRAKLTSAHFGWLPENEEQALDEIYATVMNDSGDSPMANGSYLDEFLDAYDVDLSSSGRDEIVDAVVNTLAEYVRLLKTPETASYDALAYLNRFGTKVEDGELAQDYVGRLFGRIANQEGRILIKFPKDFDEDAYQGFKTFMRMWQDGPEAGHIGACVACHHPAKFSDFSFHNTGVSQLAYDNVHGDGAYAALAIPGPDAPRPNADFNAIPDADDPSKVDLGHWNRVDLANSELRNDGESDEAFLARMAGAFKTPPLRNLDLSDPYMHNGQYETLEDVIRHKIKISQMAKDGTLVNPDPALKWMDIGEEDIAPLVAFLQSLHEVEVSHFREVVLEDTRIRPDPITGQV